MKGKKTRAVEEPEATTFSVRFSDKVRLYDTVLGGAAGRVFVPTKARLAAGEHVDLSLLVGGSPTSVAVHAVVAASRTRAGSQRLGAVGAWVEVDAASQAVVRESLGVSADDAASLTGRGRPRFPATVRVLVEKPVALSYRTVNVSADGLALDGVLPPNIPVGQVVELSIDFGSTVVSTFASVQWRDAERGSTGLQLRFQNENVRRAVARAAAKLGERRKPEGGATALLVSGDAPFLEQLEEALPDDCDGSIVAATSVEALSIARRDRPAIILIDARTHEAQAPGLCLALRRDAETSQLPVVLIGHAPGERLDDVLEESGALAAVSWPAEPDRLRQLTSSVLDQHQSLLESRRPVEHDDRRAGPRRAVSRRCFYRSASLTLETDLRDLSIGGGFVASYWGDLPGTRAELVISIPGKTSTVEVEVVRRVDWGSDRADGAIPGLGLRFLGGDGLDDVMGWLDRLESEVDERPMVAIVDDDYRNNDELGEALREAGLRVVVHDRLFGLADAIARNRPALVLLDPMMPGVDADRICAQLLAHEPTSRTVVWLTSWLDSERLEQLTWRARAEASFTKGTSAAALAGRIRQRFERGSGEKGMPDKA